jgi:hypothetical protein
MAYELIKARIPFRQVYTLLPRGRERFYDWFRGEVELKIDVVDPVSAPVAYEVRLGSDMAPRALSYQIRSYQDKLWWPLGGDHTFVVHRQTHRTALEEGRSLEHLALLDPSCRSYDGPWPLDSFPYWLKDVEHELNNSDDRRKAAEVGACRTIICNDGVYVAAGEPIFYATGDRKALCLTVGVSDEDRECNGESSAEPGPSRDTRKACARRGFAFAIGEVEEGVRALKGRGYTFRQTHGVEVRLERHRPETAAVRCAQALAASLFEECRGDGRGAEALRAGIPILGSAQDELEALGLHVVVLGQFSASSNPVVAYHFLEKRRAARSILNRLDRFGLGLSLEPADEEALALLAL